MSIRDRPIRASPAARLTKMTAVIFVSLAAGLALMGSSRPVFALVGVGLILVLSLPFLLFAFVTTLLNHIQLNPVEGEANAS